jgi:hypothetical protein
VLVLCVVGGITATEARLLREAAATSKTQVWSRRLIVFLLLMRFGQVVIVSTELATLESVFQHALCE